MKASTVRSSAPFGTIVTTPRYIKNYDGIELKNYFVQDTGVNPNLSTFAIDIWWGFCRTNAYLGSDTRLGCSTNDGAYSSALRWGKPLMKLEFITPP